MRHLSIVLLVVLACHSATLGADPTSTGALLVDLVPGKTWSWRDVSSGSGASGGSRTQRSFETYARLRLTILSVEIVSGTGMLCEVQTRTDDSMHVLPGGLFSESWSTSSVTDTLTLQVDPQAGRSLISGTDVRYKRIVSGLLAFPADRSEGDGMYVRTQGDSSYAIILKNTLVMRRIVTTTLRKTFGAVSIDYVDWERSDPSSAPSSYSDVKGTLELLSMDSIVRSDGAVPPNPLQSVTAQRAARGPVEWIASLADLSQDLHRRPAATVRLTSVSGKSEIHSGADALRMLRTRHGIVLLELRDRDVSIPGRLLLP